MRISSEWVTRPKQGTSSGRIAIIDSRQAGCGMAFPPYLIKYRVYLEYLAPPNRYFIPFNIFSTAKYLSQNDQFLLNNYA